MDKLFKFFLFILFLVQAVLPLSATAVLAGNNIMVIPVPTTMPELLFKTRSDTRSWTKSSYSKAIFVVSKKYKVDPQVIYATIMTESEGNRFAYRYEPHLHDASLGLGQILTTTARSLGFSGNDRDLYEPEVSIDLIGRYYRYMLDTYGELSPLQLATAYNAGSPWHSAVYGHLARFNMWLLEENPMV